MSLKDVNIQIEYRSLIDNISKDFYNPLLAQAIEYKRAVGFFSSTALVEISKGISGLVKNGGKIRLIASPNLSNEDVEAIRLGYKNREEVVHDALMRELVPPKNSSQAERLNFLANLIADNILDIKIALTESGSGIGMYHEKLGIITDSDGNKVAFSGSMNESLNAFKTNYETIDVFRSWTNDNERVEIKERAFNSIWDDVENGVRVYRFEEVTNEFINKYRKSEVNYEDYCEKDDLNNTYGSDNEFFRIPDKVDFFDYQKDAMDIWIKRGCYGIYDMATGTGKTYTALGSLCKLSAILHEELAVVIVVPYQHLVEQWMEDIELFNVHPIKAYSYPGQKWRKEFRDAVQAYNVGAIKNFCIISTNATFMLNDYQEILSKFKRNYCFVVDEAHNLGAENICRLLPKKARYRLALSATIERFRDEKGTEALYKYFGKEPCISFSLKEAIKKKFLTPYYYYPVLVYLDGEELSEYNELTKLIIKNGYQAGVNVEKGSYLELLLIKRARIIAGCHQKVDKLIEMIEPYKDKNHILIYCGATKYDRTDVSDVGEIRQIDEINRRLYSDFGMKVRKFTSTENSEERTEIKNMFISETIQAITAIKCLDEGVNIPAINTAFILASSTNPKEYIQRRGRVLRKAPNKEYAVIYDFITLPRPLDRVKLCSNEEKKLDLTLVKREFDRMLDFADSANNPSEIDGLRQKILDTYNVIVSMEDETYG